MTNILLASGIGQTILSVIVAILILLATITVHEFGHYIVGKIFKFKINEFAIGMGPAIFKKTKKNGEVFSIRIFPLGGFCAFEGEDSDGEESSEEIQEKPADKPVFEDFEGEITLEEPIKKEKKFTAGSGFSAVQESGELSEDAFNKKAPWKRILVLIAGATFNFIAALLIVMISFTAYGHFGFAANEIVKTGEAIVENQSLKEGDVLLAIDGKFLYFTTDLADALDGKKKGDLVEVEVMREGKRQTTTVALRQDVKTDGMTDIYPALDALGFATVPLVVTENSAIKDGSYLFRFKDSEVYEECTRIYTLDTLHQGLKDLKPNESIEIWVLNGEEKEVVKLTAPANYDTINTASRKDVLTAFGIKSAQYYYQMDSVSVKLGFFEGLGKSFVYSFKTIGVTFRSIGEMIGGKISLDQVSGPVGTVALTSQFVSMGFKYVLNIASLIGLSVAIFNLLPIPALDGARAVFVLIEWIRGKPVNRKVENTIHSIGLILLLVFAIGVDLIKLF